MGLIFEHRAFIRIAACTVWIMVGVMAKNVGGYLSAAAATGFLLTNISEL